MIYILVITTPNIDTVPQIMFIHGNVSPKALLDGSNPNIDIKITMQEKIIDGIATFSHHSIEPASSEQYLQSRINKLFKTMILPNHKHRLFRLSHNLLSFFRSAT